MFKYNVKIVKIIDGDTAKVDIDLGFDVWLKNENIRFYGIDAPESRTRDPIEKFYGLLAKEEVKKLLPIGSTQKMESTKFKSGKFGRILGIFFLYDSEKKDWFTLNNYLIENNLAIKFDGKVNRKSLKEEHLKNRKVLAKRGIIINNGKN